MKHLNVRQKPVDYEANFYSEELPEDEARKLADWAGATLDPESFVIRIPSIGGCIAALPGVHWILRHPNGAISVCPTYSFYKIFDVVIDGVAYSEDELSACDCVDADEHTARCGVSKV